MSHETVRRRLLVVDDEEIICQIVQGFMGVEGWDVDSVRDVPGAYAVLEQQSYPVVLCDVHLPGNSTELLHCEESLSRGGGYHVHGRSHREHRARSFATRSV